jgi:hypothetical protein
MAQQLREISMTAAKKGIHMQAGLHNLCLMPVAHVAQDPVMVKQKNIALIQFP